MSAPALDRVMVLSDPRAGQLRMVLPGVVRVPYPTGQQEQCEACAAAGVARQGVSRAGSGSAPLCLPCWRSREQRRARAEQAELDQRLWDSMAELDAAAAAEEACAACGEPEASPACWLCGYAWLRQLREQFDADQAAAAAEAALESTRITARTEAEDLVADATGWIERLQTTVTAYESGGGRGRAVELLADLLARLAAARTNVRGRPSVTPYVGAAVAVDADWRSGRRAMPGRERTAWLVGCSDRAVYDGWKRIVEMGWATRVRLGGRNTLERRVETGRANDRAEFDIVPLHRSEVDAGTRARFVPAALELLGELLAHALTVLDEAQRALDELRARTETWTDWPEHVRRMQLRAAVTQVCEAITGPIPAALLTTNICRPHTVSKGEYLSSCSSWGLRFSRQIMIHSDKCAPQPHGRRKNGASRSPTTRVSELGGIGCGSSCVKHPRTAKGLKCRSQPRMASPWAAWAPSLARDLVALWPWLASVKRPRLVATLGSRLGPDWSATKLTRWIIERRLRPVLAAPAAPLAYLRTVLDEVFASDTEPPYPARAHTEHRRQVAAAASADQVTAHEKLRAQFDSRDAAAAAATGSGQAAVRAELARITAARHSRRPTVLAGCSWPEVAEPGNGSRGGPDLHARNSTTRAG